jgi:hypothetical protein
LQRVEKANPSLLENHQGEPDYEPEARTTNRSRVAFAAKTSSQQFFEHDAATEKSFFP